MNVSSKHGTGRILVVVLALILFGFGSSALRAQNESCPKACPAPPAPICCPAPVLERPCMTPQVCAPPPAVICAPRLPDAPNCCPQDPKDTRRLERANARAQHEAAEAYSRQQRTIDRAQRKLDRQTAKQNKRIERANAHLNHELSEWQDAFAAAGYTTVEAEAATPQPEPEVTRAKPEPEPAPVYEPTPAPAPTPIPVIIVPETPAPTPAPAPVPEVPAAKHLPKTASPMPLVGLVGLLSMTGFSTRFFRRR